MEKQTEWRTDKQKFVQLYVGGTTFGHRPEARAQFDCNDKVSSRLRAKTEAPAARTDSPQATTKRSEEWRRLGRLRRGPVRHKAKTKRSGERRRPRRLRRRPVRHKAKTKRSGVRRRPRRLWRRPGHRLRTRRPEGKASDSKRFESRAENLVMGPIGCNGPNGQKRLGCNLPDDVKIRLYPGNIPGI